MLLDRIDIDSHGPLARIGLGPFSQQLNVITAPAGSGKTALVRFLRDSLTGTTPAYEGLAKSSGRVVWAAADGLYHCRREPNGTTQGRRFVEFESRLAGPAQAWNRPAVVVDLPATIVDGIVTDTTVTSLRRIVQAVLRSGLDQAASGTDQQPTAEIAALRAEIEHLRNLLQHHGHAAGGVPSEDQIRDRLAALTMELSAIDSRRQYARQTEAAAEQSRRDRAAISQAVQEIDRLRTQETDLRKRIQTLDQALVRLAEQARQEEHRIALTQLTRTRVHWLNQQIDRLRGVLSEVRSLGDDWFGGSLATGRGHRAATERLLQLAPQDHAVAPLRRDELEIIDRGWLSRSRPAAAESLARTELEARLDAICRLVDHLSGRLEAEQEHWIGAEHPAAEICGEATTESELALQRLRQGDADASGSIQPRLSEDPGWVEDSLRRRRIDALRRAEQRRRLDETADLEQIHGRPQNALELTLRTIGTALQSVSRRLRVLRAQRHLGVAEPPAWSTDAWLEGQATEAAPLPPAERAEALRRCETELVAALQRLAQHRVTLLRRVAQAQQLPESLLQALVADASILPATVDEWLTASLSAAPNQQGGEGSTLSGHDREAERQKLESQRRAAAEELDRTIERMNEQLAAAETLRARLSPLRLQAVSDEEQLQRDRIEAEIERLHRLLAARETPLLQRYRQCVSRLQQLETQQHLASPLAERASSYLRRLSGGRLPSVHWQSVLDRPSGRQQLAVLLASQPEAHCSDVDRFLGGLAVRLAAADELTRRGRPLPLIIETPSRVDAFTELQSRYGVQPLQVATSFHPPQARIEDLVATLAEATERGRQVILLTEDQRLANAIVGAGGRSYALDGARSTSRVTLQDVHHNFDVTWQATPAADEGAVAETVASSGDDSADALERSPFDRPSTETAATSDSAARAYAIPVTSRSGETAAAKAPRFRFGQRSIRETAEGEATVADERDVVMFPTRHSAAAHGRSGGENSPFFLSGDSPVEQSPSVDVLAAAKLRRLGITVVAQLLSASPQELAAQLQMADINAATVRRWQNECRLVCGVPGLRGFDARVLVGCGMIHPREIEEISPAELVEKVETFLATPRGVQILRTGTSHEIARLTGWMAEARHLARSGDVAGRESVSSESGQVESFDRPLAASARRERVASGEASEELRRGGRKGASRTRIRRAAETTQTAGYRATSAAEPATMALTGQAAAAEVAPSAAESTPALKFYLHRHSPIVDAPSIGPRMAERLARLKIVNVEDLLAAKPAAVASGLKLRRVDESLVRSWQQQAKLVCRVPMLRGHDAQLLVAAGITEPERLAQCDPQWLLTQIDPISRSREGQSILRGGPLPDLAEISSWIRYAKQHRELRAA